MSTLLVESRNKLETSTSGSSHYRRLLAKAEFAKSAAGPVVIVACVISVLPCRPLSTYNSCPHRVPWSQEISPTQRAPFQTGTPSLTPPGMSPRYPYTQLCQSNLLHCVR